MDSLFTYSGTRLARMIRAQEISSFDVVNAHILHIKRVNPSLNAIVAERYEPARQEARAADRRIRLNSSDLPPFYGVPCSIKEAFALKGMPNTAGLAIRKGHSVERDAVAVARLRKAGAIPLGVTNMSELGMWMESYNKVYGRTNNPYDNRRTVGGSSGGEGAIISAGGSPFGLGSDVGGSIRMPAFFNGVFGHKPTGGLVPNTGQFPMAQNQGRRYQTTGPMCRRAEDIYPLLRVLAAPNDQDEHHQSYRVRDPSSVTMRQLSVLDVADNGVVNVSKDLREAQRRAGDALTAVGARVRRAQFRGLRQSFEIWAAMLTAAGGPSFAELMGNGTAIAPRRELLRWATRRSSHTFPAVGLALLETVPRLLPSNVDRLVEQGKLLRQELVDRIGDGVMLFPSYATPAPRHLKPMWPPFQWIYTAIINVMELPSTQVPLGLNKRGLPLGVQVVAAHGNDHLTIATALELERAFGGWVPPE